MEVGETINGHTERMLVRYNTIDDKTRERHRLHMRGMSE